MPAILGAAASLQDDDAARPDRRGPPRKRVLIPAIAVCPRGAEYRCVLRDVSVSGAKIGIACSARLPGRFKLVTGRRPEGYPVRLIWQRGNFAGLALDLPGAV